LTVALEGGLEAAVEAFHAEHERTFGYRSESSSVDLVNLRVVISIRGSGAVAELVSHQNPSPSEDGLRLIEPRPVHFGPTFGTLEIAALANRSALGPSWQQGPIIIEEYDSTCVVPPDAHARIDDHGNIEIRFK
jgi:N-methylhydantoinase A